MRLDMLSFIYLNLLLPINLDTVYLCLSRILSYFDFSGTLIVFVKIIPYSSFEIAAISRISCSFPTKYRISSLVRPFICYFIYENDSYLFSLLIQYTI